MKQAVIISIEANVIQYFSNGVQGELTLPERSADDAPVTYSVDDIIFIDEDTNEITGMLTKQQIAETNKPAAAPKSTPESKYKSGGGRGSTSGKHDTPERY